MSHATTRLRACRIAPAVGLAVLVAWSVGCGKQEPVAPVEPTGTAGRRNYIDVLKNVRKRSAQNMDSDRLKSALESFEMELGRNPTNLEELLARGYINEIPKAPDGLMYSYDPTNNMIRVIPAPDAPGRQGDTLEAVPF